MIIAENICKKYGGRNILSGVSMRVRDGEFVSVMGKSGSGKSTLLGILAGNISADSGRVIIDGEDITDLSITERANKGISFAFQQPVRFKGITVKDLISLAAGKKLSTGEACEYLAEVGLCAKEYVGREVNASLSGGEHKRNENPNNNPRGTKNSH